MHVNLMIVILLSEIFTKIYIDFHMYYNFIHLGPLC